MIVLGIETSCDETAAAVITDAATPSARILSNVVYSQLADHEIHGGVVPEIAARAHLEKIDIIIRRAMDAAGLDYDALDGVAATCGPGLIGGVMVGMLAAKAIALATDKPFIAVNHLEGHALTARLSHDVPFPYLLLLVSGGHTQTLIVRDVGDYECIGTTVDDAAGECFDKSAKMMGLPYPGGPNLEKLAAECTDGAAAIARYALPRPMKGRKDGAFSFSGLKTAVRNHVEAVAATNPADAALPRAEMAWLAFAFQDAMQDILTDRVAQAIAAFRDRTGLAGRAGLVVAGGVAANGAVRAALLALAAKTQMDFIAPPAALCTDNGAMIAWAGLERLRLGGRSALDAPARPRWPLAELMQPDADGPQTGGPVCPPCPSGPQDL